MARRLVLAALIAAAVLPATVHVVGRTHRMRARRRHVKKHRAKRPR
jgi:hypothetical protein